MVFPCISRLLIRQKTVLFLRDPVLFLPLSLSRCSGDLCHPSQVCKGYNTTQIQFMKACKCKENRAEQQCTYLVWIFNTMSDSCSLRY